MECITSLFKQQVLAGRYFLHEHPLCATSWKLECILEVMDMNGVGSEWCDQCQYGQDGGTGEPVKKPTRWMSNSPEILKMLEMKCGNKEGRCSRPGGAKHRLCTGDVARTAALYPVNLCKAITQGCRAQLREDGRIRFGHVGILPRESDEGSDGKLKSKTEKLVNVQIEKGDQQEFKDSVTGQVLVADLVREARREEM